MSWSLKYDLNDFVHFCFQLVGIVVSCYMCCTVKNDDEEDEDDEENEAHV